MTSTKTIKIKPSTHRELSVIASRRGAKLGDMADRELAKWAAKQKPAKESK